MEQTNQLQKNQAIGLMGGTFDPIHLGHLRLAWEASALLGLTQMEIMPCHLPPHRDTPSSDAAHRIKMARLACAETSNFHVNDWEIEKHSESYTVETLQYLRDQTSSETPLIFVMGMDAFRLFCRWHRWQDILNLCHLWVAHRPGSQPPETHSDEYALLEKNRAEHPHDLLSSAAGSIHVHNTTALDISATQLREDIQQGFEPRFLLPDTVWHYIKLHQLYGWQ
ncbi:nicotinate (nicotinamide) nucleotide adenylyltransferase [Gammaproteobacteria bacterium 42_54_T18]|nr:nicotinate (nicotinamide) nucleotide adenylyltransferase [Gammaproteobacteria bacterium 42_54_T18]